MDRVNGETLKRRYRNKYIRAGSKREKTRIIDTFMEATGLRSRGHARRLLKGRNQKKPHPDKGGRPRVYDSVPLKQTLVFMWRNLDYPSSHLLKAAIPTQIQMMKAHGHNIEPEIEALLLKISRSTIERILSPIRRQEKADLHRWRTTRNRALTQKVPIAIDQPRPHEPGHLQVDLTSLSGGEASGYFGYILACIDRFTLWFEAEPCLGRSQEAVLEALKGCISRFPFEIKSFQTDNGSEFLNAHLIAFCEDAGIDLMRSRPYRKNNNAYVEGSIGNILEEDYRLSETRHPSRDRGNKTAL